MPLHRGIRGFALVVAILMAAPGRAHAWHESGHRIVARIAWDELTPAQQTFVSELLVRHPRFADDFFKVMPEALKARPEADPERRRWVFMHAAIWPDLIRGEVRALTRQLEAAGDGPDKPALERRLADARKYDNSTWHYDNKPIYLDPYALPPAPPAAPARTLGIQQALPNALAELGDRSLPAEKRAVALAWVVHLLGDSHQPLHAAALFTADLLPQGDLGGNRVIVTVPTSRETPTNLHAVWDGLFNSDEKAEPILKRRIVATHPRRKLLAEVSAPAGATVQARVDLWLDESYRAADASVYDASVRDALLAAPPVSATPPAPVALDRRYLQAAKTVATRRVALAGYRLADCIARAEAQR